MDGFQSAETQGPGAFLSVTEVMSCGCSRIALPARVSEVLQTNSNVVREIHQNSPDILESYGIGLTHPTGEMLLLPPHSASLADCRMSHPSEIRLSIPTGMTPETSRHFRACGSSSISLADAWQLVATQSFIVATANTSNRSHEPQLFLPTPLWLPNRDLRRDDQIHREGGTHLNQAFGTSRR